MSIEFWQAPIIWKIKCENKITRETLINSYIQPRITTAKELIKELWKQSQNNT